MFLVKYIWLNLKAVFNYELTTEEKEYIHCVKFIEATIESIPQIGLSFYIIYHHGFVDNSALQVLSLAGSILSMNFGMATRRAWRSEKRDSEEEPHTMMVLKAFLWNLIPITCFLITYFFMMICSSNMLMVFISAFLGVTIISLFLSWKTKSVILTMNRFLFIVAIIMSSMYTVQELAYPEGFQNCTIPFNNYCENKSCIFVMETVKSPPVLEKLNQTAVKELKHNLTVLEKTKDTTEKENNVKSLLEETGLDKLLEDTGIESIDESVEDLIEKLDKRYVKLVIEQIKEWRKTVNEHLEKVFPKYPYVFINWIVVVVFLLFLLVEEMCGEKQEEFYRFIMVAKL